MSPCSGAGKWWSHAMGSRGTVLVSTGSPGCSGRCSCCCKVRKKPFALSLSLQCHLILPLLLHLLHPRGLYPASGVPPQPPALPGHLGTHVPTSSQAMLGTFWGWRRHFGQGFEGSPLLSALQDQGDVAGMERGECRAPMPAVPGTISHPRSLFALLGQGGYSAHQQP